MNQRTLAGFCGTVAANSSRAAALVATVLISLSAGAAGAESAAPSDPPPNWRANVRALAEQNFRHPAWGYSHSARIYTLAKSLAAQDGAALDDDVLYAAAFLHDMAAFPPWFDAARDHADVAAELAEGKLRDTGFPMAKLDAVRGAIRTHMYFRDPVGPEATYIHDADALDWLGAIGAARMLALVDPKGAAPDGPAAARMIQDNLSKVPGRTFSPAGKAREAERRAQLESFLRNLDEQTAGFVEF